MIFGRLRLDIFLIQSKQTCKYFKLLKCPFRLTFCFRATKTLYLPELIQFYWKDFGGSYVSVCAMVQNDGEPTVQADLRNLLAVTAHPKVVFVPYDWNACLVLPT